VSSQLIYFSAKKECNDQFCHHKMAQGEKEKRSKIEQTDKQGVGHSSPLPIKTEIVGTRFERKSWFPVPVLMGAMGICLRP
jgi:hypothetical protein